MNALDLARLKLRNIERDCYKLRTFIHKYERFVRRNAAGVFTEQRTTGVIYSNGTTAKRSDDTAT
jgi:hypothetical protein